MGSDIAYALRRTQESLAKFKRAKGAEALNEAGEAVSLGDPSARSYCLQAVLLLSNPGAKIEEFRRIMEVLHLAARNVSEGACQNLFQFNDLHAENLALQYELIDTALSQVSTPYPEEFIDWKTAA